MNILSTAAGFTLLFAVTVTAWAQGPTLESADLAVVGYNTDLNDQFALVALAPIPANSVIFITDEGWDDSDFMFDGGEDVHRWITPATELPAGTIIRFTNAASIFMEISDTAHGVVTQVNGTSDMSLAAGDQLFIYQTNDGTYNGTIQRKAGASTESGMIYAFNGDNSMPQTYGWLDPGNSHTSTATQAPDFMTVLETTDGSGNAAVANANGMLTQGTLKGGLPPNEYDNYRYDGPVTTATKSEWLVRLHTTANWLASDADTLGVFAGALHADFLVGSPCTEPDVPTVSSGSPSACNEASVTLTIAGNLNDGTAWHVYSGSCGGTSLGTTASSTFPLTLPSTAGSVTYYVRGEGGCTTPGTCGTVSINVLADDDAGFSYSNSSYQLSTPNPTPSITGVSGGTFEASSTGLVINANTGEIDLNASTTGNYSVTYTTAGSCPNAATEAISILAAPLPPAEAGDFISTESIAPKLYQSEEIAVLLDSINNILYGQSEPALTRWDFVDAEVVDGRTYAQIRLQAMADTLNALNQAP